MNWWLRLGSRGSMNLGGNLHKPRYSIIEESFVCLTKVAFGAVIFFVERRPVLHTAAPADGQMPADKALVAEIFLCSSESSLFTAGGKFFYRRLEDIA